MGLWGRAANPAVPPADNSIQSVITFDRGGEWVPLRKPKNTTCDSTARSREEVDAGCSVPNRGRPSPPPRSEPPPGGVGMETLRAGVCWGDAHRVLPHPCRHSRPGWMWLWAAWAAGW